MSIFSYSIPELKLELELIAIYLRKSRGDKDKDVLVKHRNALTDYAKKLGVPYVIYEEIGDSDSIEFRPEFKKLLNDVGEKLYDAVLVMDIDRLSRGDWGDVATYRKAFIESNTLVLTPHSVVDFSNEEKSLSYDLEALVARQEYFNIKKRFRRGKINGLYLKQWVNGPAPFPYIYDSHKKGLIVNEAELPIYEMMKNDYLNGYSQQKIAFKLNNMGILTRKNNTWSATTVGRVLFSEVHLGRIIYGKTTGSGHKNKKAKPLKYHPRDNWIIIENCHQAVKTLEEHEQMLLIRESRQKVPKRSRSGTFILSGILYCANCGYALRINRKQTKKGESNYVIRCQHKDRYGQQCNNPGIDVNIILDVIEKELKQYLETLSSNLHDSQNPRKKVNSIIQIKEKAKEQAFKKIARINDGFAGGLYTLVEAKKLKQEQEKIINKLDLEIAEFSNAESNYNGLSVEEKKSRIQNVLSNLHNPKIEVSEINRLLRFILERVSYKREGNNIDLDFKFY